MELLLLVALVAGLLSILAPCTWPVLPIVLGTSTGGGARRPAGVVVGLVATFVMVTVVLASALAALGLTSTGLRTVSVIVLALVAISLLAPVADRWVAARLSRPSRMGARIGALTRGHDGFAAGLLLGGAIGLLWAPCVGPIMAGVIAIAATRGPSIEIVAVAVAYGVGIAVPLLFVATRGRTGDSWLGNHLRGETGRRILGAAMLVSCLAIATGADLRLQTTIADALPFSWTGALYGIEKTPAVEARVRGLEGSTSQIGPVAGSSSATGLGAAAVPDVVLGDFGPAPELRGITDWINSKPLTLASLRGKVVLVHFWTFGCVNCRNVQPYVKAWYERYHAQGLEIIGVHTPELSYEREIANVRKAVADEGVTFPVAFDPAFATWNGYSNSYWPAFYYVDRSGEIRYEHVGEGSYEEQEAVIRDLLAGVASR